MILALFACAAHVAPPPAPATATCSVEGAWVADFGPYDGRVEVAGAVTRLVGKASRELPLTRSGVRLTIGSDTCTITAGSDTCTEVTCAGSTLPTRWWR